MKALPTPVRHGFYHDASYTAYPSRMVDYRREQVSRGMTTATASDGSFCTDSISNLTLVVESLLEAGLAFPDEPLLMWGDAADVYHSFMRRTRSWPIPILCIGDDSDPSAINWLLDKTDDAHRHFFRSASTTTGYFVKEGKIGEGGKMLGEAFDVWIINAPTWQPDTEKNAKALGKELWAYYTCSSSGDYERMRYAAGLWCWTHAPRQFLVWAYVGDKKTMVRPDGVLCIAEADTHSFAIPRHDGTVISTVGYDGYAKGIEDCRVLEAASASDDPKVIEFLQSVREKVPCSIPRPGRDLPDLRGEEVLRRLEEFKPCTLSHSTLGVGLPPAERST